MAFPKTGDNRDLMMQAPAEVEEKQLKELHIKVIKKSKNGGEK
jgi:aspartyl-tRNA synthetase